MYARLRNTAFIAALAVSSMGSSCIQITDPLVISLNVKDITGTYSVTPGTVNFDPSCTTKSPSQYLDSGFNVQPNGARLVDVTVQTIGTFGASVTGGEIRIGATTATATTPLVTYAGTWAAFNTPQSLILTPTPLTRNSAGVTLLLSLIQNQQNIVICHAGAFTQAAPAGLQIVVKVFAQLSASP